MQISAISNIIFQGNNDQVHKDYIPAGNWAGSIRSDRFEKIDRSVIIVDDQGDVTGRYAENRFGHLYGYLITGADLSKSRELILSADEEPNKNILYSVMEKNLSSKKPLEGIFARFEQFTTLTTGTPKTGITLIDLATGRKMSHLTLKGHKIPTVEDIEEYVLRIKADAEEYKKHPERFLSPAQAAEALREMFEKNKTDKN